ncbi:excinuclease ABC subunit UvrA [Elizabethkingia anophelis]|uniref:UvrABC system protein A n=1 Tax=Elizabethkingia anophelis NUHP1 TaxID=1338011 RepID=A0A077ECG6_9FLAO|nr:excinuclease ABC subunit UvrA [Elizabethkingia anophelis]AIL45127.1 Excinuclease ABC subunit A-like protein [Elizabethkingia anophelis NUHP1]MBE9393575.1 excinuclease ABC subunit UvrA [Elizabethkingia anophelis]MBE9405825.1 excinuclease ABC subunit UvrA [Elizabethkingia anophelis]MCT3801224.1 excinuclease ABC subunit UvrA [Elizabethkingia anophelis]MCT4057652.1 excinuclease ABC subunit UvrA [Elizabethkingia anophelis]
MAHQDNIDIKKEIFVKNAHLNNLKHIDVSIPKNKLTVITGVSGSGKSSLAFDTIYAEGQRRYVESLSSYARQFLGKLEKPKIDDIKGLAPSIAIQQKVISSNPRSTVGTTTEIYDYLKLLFARVGRTYSPVSGEEVRKDSVTDVIDFIKAQKKAPTLILRAPWHYETENFAEQLKTLKLQGFTRLEIGGNVASIEDLESFGFEPEAGTEIFLVIDRFKYEDDETFLQRLADSIQMAFYEGKGYCSIKNADNEKIREFSNKFELDDIVFNEPNIHFFSFNNPYGACPTCEGYGKIIGIDEDLVVPNKNLSVYEDAVAPWRGETMKEWKAAFIKKVAKDFPIHKPYFQLTKEQRQFLWRGDKTANFPGVDNFFKMLEENLYKIQYRVMLSRYRGKTTCPTCEGLRLREESSWVKIDGYNIQSMVELPLDELLPLIQSLNLNEHDAAIAKRLVYEIVSRLEFLVKVGLGYLTLNRNSNTLSGGESQRINLATSLGSSLVGSIYILDEPSIGLHSRDTENLIEVLKNLRDLGNTVIVVEHDEDVMRAADHIIDIGPEAGYLGGEVVFSGDFEEIKKANTLTSDYLNGVEEIAVPKHRRKPKEFIHIKGARENNLKNVDVDIPLESLVVVTGVSGSGKSTLMKDVLAQAVQIELELGGKKADFDSITFPKKLIQNIEMIDQNPIGKSSRSNPVTYLKAYDDIRDLFAKQKMSKHMGLKAKHFSFNVDGGRCDECKGEGVITVSMQFMADIELQCETCHGTRFKDEILDVKFDEKNISDILNLTVNEALDFFRDNHQDKIVQKLKPLQDVGLGYLQLGQSSSTLSGGEAQRVKLASFLVKGTSHDKTLFIFDEPSTGLHFHDINKLMISLQALVNLGHSVIVIEHQPDIIKCADYIIDIGPEAGKYGGEIVFAGTPEELIKNKTSHTARFIEEKLK